MNKSKYLDDKRNTPDTTIIINKYENTSGMYIKLSDDYQRFVKNLGKSYFHIGNGGISINVGKRENISDFQFGLKEGPKSYNSLIDINITASQLDSHTNELNFGLSFDAFKELSEMFSKIYNKLKDDKNIIWAKEDSDTDVLPAKNSIYDK